MKKNINFKNSIKKVAVTRCKFLLNANSDDNCTDLVITHIQDLKKTLLLKFLLRSYSVSIFAAKDPVHE